MYRCVRGRCGSKEASNLWKGEIKKKMKRNATGEREFSKYSSKKMGNL
jgi:hypothetical protein